MICWDRSGEVIIGTFSRAQLDWLGRHFDCLRTALDSRIGQYTIDYPLGDVIGVALPREHPEDKVLLALVDYYMATEPPEIRLLWEPELFEQISQALRTATDLIPPTGGLVSLPDQRSLTDWLWAVEALGVATAAALERPELMRDPHPPAPRDAPCFLISWLRGIFESLTDIAYPTPTS